MDKYNFHIIIFLCVIMPLIGLTFSLISLCLVDSDLTISEEQLIGIKCNSKHNAEMLDKIYSELRKLNSKNDEICENIDC